MKPSLLPTTLIRQAETLALQMFSGQPLTLGPEGTITRLGNVIRHILVTQVALGLWDSIIPRAPGLIYLDECAWVVLSDGRFESPAPEGGTLVDRVEYSGFQNLQVEFRIGNPAKNEPAVIVDYNFAKTRVPLLRVKHADKEIT